MADIAPRNIVVKFIAETAEFDKKADVTEKKTLSIGDAAKKAGKEGKEGFNQMGAETEKLGNLFTSLAKKIGAAFVALGVIQGAGNCVVNILV
jgi:hypothetical protein